MGNKSSNRMSTTIQDLTLKGTSSCCDAKVYVGDVCADCGEHCDAVMEETV